MPAVRHVDRQSPHQLLLSKFRPILGVIKVAGGSQMCQLTERFGGVLRLKTQDLSGVLKVAIAPLVVGSGKEDVVFQVVRRFDAFVKDVGYVSVAQEDGVFSRSAWAVFTAY